jgi:uncharacterized protein YciI
MLHPTVFARALLLCGLLVAAPVIATADDATPTGTQAIGRANPHKLSAYVVLLRLRTDVYLKWKATGVWSADPDTDKALEAHSAYWDAQLKAGHAILAGAMGGDYWDNVAMVIFEADSLKDAERIANEDPAVKAYAFQAQVRPFDVFFLTNKYGLASSAKSGDPGHLP